jgi:hypothetical protein
MEGPVRSLEEAQADPRFKASAISEDARVKVAEVEERFAYYGIPSNGCSAGRAYVMSELLGAFDGMGVGSKIVIRVEDPALGPATAGASLAFSGLKRAGKGQDGRMVYCGKGTATALKK